MKPWRKIRSLFQKRKLDAEMSEEMRLHLELQTERNLAAGMNPAEARYAAQRLFGGLEQIKEQAREQRGWSWLEQFLQDLRYGVRLLRKNPGFTTSAVAVLALGIGANAAVYDFVHSLLLAPMTFARPAEILRVLSEDKQDSRKTRDFSYPAYQEIREQNPIFSDALASTLLVVGVGEKGDTRRAAAAVVSSNYFSVLGVMPTQGRAFRPEEETLGRATPVAIVSHTFWEKHHFDPGFLGSTVSINSRPFTVIGIMPEGFGGTTALFFTEIWLPLGVYDQVVNNASTVTGDSLASRGSSALMILGRLKPGLTPANAAPAFKAFAANLEKSFPIEQKNQVLTIAPLSRFASNSNDAAVAWVGALLLAMAAVVLLVACLNLANMLLARGTARRKEIALRLAMGGGRVRIVRQLLTEGFLLAVLGGTAGLVLALWSSALLTTSLGRMIPIDLVWMAKPQPALLAATFGFCVLAVLAFALGPALKLSRADVMAHLKEQAGEDVMRRRWKFLPRNPLVSAQIALSLALLTSAMLFIRSAAQAGAVVVGLKSDRVFLVEVDAGLGGHNQNQAQDLYRRLSERFATLVGVENVGVSVDVPLAGIDLEYSVQRAGEPKSATSVKWNGVNADYFRTVGLPLLHGRAFSIAEATQPGSPPVVIVNEVLAKQLWPDGNALGQRVQLHGKPGTSSATSAVRPDDSYEVVGIVPAVRHNLFESDPDGAIYLPFVRGFQSHVFFHVKFASLPPDGEGVTAESLRRAVSKLDPTLPVLSLQTFGHYLENNIQIYIVRTGAALFSTFGVLALCLAGVGVYGVVAYSVSRRTREIGIRMALGARRDVVQRMILREGAVMLVSGLAIGLVLSLGIGKVVSGLLYRVGALDPVAFSLAPGVLAAATFLACWLPARRATKVDPIVALRCE